MEYEKRFLLHMLNVFDDGMAKMGLLAIANLKISTLLINPNDRAIFSKRIAI